MYSKVFCYFWILCFDVIWWNHAVWCSTRKSRAGSTKQASTCCEQTFSETADGSHPNHWWLPWYISIEFPEYSVSMKHILKFAGSCVVSSKVLFFFPLPILYLYCVLEMAIYFLSQRSGFLLAPLSLCSNRVMQLHRHVALLAEKEW